MLHNSKIKGHEKRKIAFETNFWIRYEAESPFKVIDAVFENDDLDRYKHILGEMLVYMRITQVYRADYPGAVFTIYTALRSLLKACYCLQFKSVKWKVAAPSGCASVLHQASLTREEYNDPCLVFRNAFAAKTLSEFEFFLCEAVELSLSPYTDDGHWDLMTHYIHLIKMLDAARLIRERGIEKRK